MPILNCGVLAKFHRKISWLPWLPLGLATIVHMVAIGLIIWVSQGQDEPKFKALAVINFAHYDPDGGQGGGAVEEAAPTLVPLPELQPKFTPEPKINEELKALDLITSTAEEAALVPIVPAVAKKVESKSTVKPKPSLEEKSGAGGQGSSFASKRPGGGPGQGKGGLGQGQGKGNADLTKAYLAKVVAKIKRRQKYPSAGRPKKMVGITRLRFTINSQGVVTASSVSRSSGHAILDREAMALIKRCSPFPPFPKGLEVKSITRTIPIKFTLDR